MAPVQSTTRYSAVEPGANQQVVPGLVNIDEPRWDQTTYGGRAKHFFTITNPLNLLKGDKELEEAKRIVKAYKYAFVGDLSSNRSVD